ncbi:hypothetical protein [Streptomyces iakyrus]|uniref:hypothetical protein n=1 Tax=Streptomyces iakyrus TaxID=68219 RepID=UPI0036C76BD8
MTGFVLGLIAVFAVTVVLVRKIGVSKNRRARNRSQRDVTFPEDIGVEIIDRQHHARRAVRRQYVDNVAALDIFRDLLVCPEWYVERVVEDAEIRDQSLHVQASLSLAVPTLGENDRLLVPLMWAQKGTLLYDLHVEDRDKKMLCLVPQLKVKAALEIVVKHLFVDAYLSGPKEPGAELVRNTVASLRSLVWEMNKPTSQEMASMLRALESLREEAEIGTPERRAYHYSLKRLCEVLAKSYMIAVEVQHEPRMVIKLERTVPMVRSGAGEGIWEKVRFGLRVLLGGRPNRVIFPLAWPFWTPSYHFRITGEPGQYVSEHKVQYFSENGTPLPGARHTFPPHTQASVGLPFTHAYLRNSGTERDRQIQTEVRFSEIPPGVLGTATATSILLATLVTALTWLYPQHLNVTSLPDFPAFLFAFLGIAVSWMGFSSDVESVLRSSLASRASLAATIVLTLCCAMLYANRKWMTKPTWHFGFFGGSLHSFNGWWFLAACVVIAVAVTSIGYFLWRTRKYFKIIGRSARAEN